jgi:hypothetical protein
MLTELRYQAKVHAISNKPREKKSSKFSPNLFIYFYFIKQKKCNMEMTSYANARSNLCTLNDATTEKTVPRPAFSVFPKMFLHSSLKKHWGQTQLVPRLHITICQVN